jgi:hypothetical protein
VPKKKINTVQSPSDDQAPKEFDLNAEFTAIKNADVNALEKKSETQIKEFVELLDTLSSVEDRTKALWRQIYENAVSDRKNAYIMWVDLYIHVHSNPTEHAVHGQNLGRYLERMSKANDQIIKLADLVSQASQEEIQESVSEEDIYHQILAKRQ